MRTYGMTPQQKVEYYKQFEREMKAKKKQAFKEKLTRFKEGVKRGGEGIINVTQKTHKGLTVISNYVQDLGDKRTDFLIKKNKKDVKLESLRLKKAKLKAKKDEVRGNMLGMSNSPFKLK